MKKTLKKITALLIAAALTAGLSLTAFAADGDMATEAQDEAATFKKEYTSTDETTYPAETLEFEVEADSENNPDDSMITVGDTNTFTVTGISNEVPINLPSFTKKGIYRYQITEKEGSSQGVTYDTDKVIIVAVLVAYNEEHTALVVESVGVEQNQDEVKDDTFTNVYDLGGDTPGPDGGDESLSVTKEVTGNLGDQTKMFTMTVTLTAEKTVNSDITISGGSDSENPTTIAKGWSGTKEVTIKLKHGETISFNKIPAGVTYSVEEDSSHLAADETPTTEELNSDEGYIVTYENEQGTITTENKPVVTVTNDKSTTINTGISLDSLPYLMLLAAAAIGAVMIFRRRRIED